MRLYPKTIKWQISAIIFVITVIMGIITFTILYHHLKNLMYDTLAEEGRIIASNISETAAEKLIDEDIVALKSLIEKYKYYSDIEYILIEDFNNNIKTDTFNGKIPQELLASSAKQNESESEEFVRKIHLVETNISVIDVQFPIKEGLLGFVRVGMKTSTLAEKLLKTFIYLVIILFLSTFLAILLVIFIITFNVTRPIRKLSETTEKISLGEFDNPVQVKAANEIMILAESIERMRESLKAAIKRIKSGA